MKPQIARAVVLQQASALLGESLADGRAAEFGADHLVVFATAPGCGRVVITVGEDAATDAYVLDQLRDLPVLVPRPLARGTIVANQRSYPVVIMTRAAGWTSPPSPISTAISPSWSRSYTSCMALSS